MVRVNVAGVVTFQAVFPVAGVTTEAVAALTGAATEVAGAGDAEGDGAGEPSPEPPPPHATNKAVAAKRAAVRRRDCATAAAELHLFDIDTP